jgi:hypothetical protein
MISGNPALPLSPSEMLHFELGARGVRADKARQICTRSRVSGRKKFTILTISQVARTLQEFLGNILAIKGSLVFAAFLELF